MTFVVIAGLRPKRWTINKASNDAPSYDENYDNKGK